MSSLHATLGTSMIVSCQSSTPAILYSRRRVIKSKKSGGYYPIPFSISFTSGNTQRDQVPDTLLVAPRADAKRIDTVEGGVAVYLEGFKEKFTEHNYGQRERHLRRFVEYLSDSGHSMRLQDLTFADGAEFLQNLTNARNGKRLSLNHQKGLQERLAVF